MSSRYQQRVDAVIVAGLTEAQHIALRFIARVCDSPEFGHEVDGVHPRRGQSQMFERLRLLGLLTDAGVGVSADAHERQVQLYTITATGRTALDGHAEIRLSDKRAKQEDNAS